MAEIDIASPGVDEAALESAFRTLVGDLAGMSITPVGASAAITADALAKRAGLAMLTFDQPIIVDKAGHLGDDNCVYIPRTVYFKQAGVEFDNTGGTESSELPGYVKVSVSSTATTHIYLNTASTSSPYAAQNTGTTEPTDGGPHIITTYGGGTTWRSDHAVVSTADWNAIYLPTSGIVTDGDKLLVPPGVAIGKFPRATVTVANSGYEWAAELDWSDGSGDGSYTAGYNLGTSAFWGSASTAPRSGPYMAPIAESNKGVLLTRCAVRRKYVNENPYALGASSDDIPSDLISPSTLVAVDTTDSELIALGLTRGWWSNDAAIRPYIAANLANPDTGRWAFARIHIETDTADTYGDPTMYALDADGTNLGSVTMLIDREFSDYARAYVARQQLPAGTVAIRVGIGTVTAAKQKLCGLQVACGPDQQLYVERADWTDEAYAPGTNIRAFRKVINPASTPDVILPDTLYFLTGRKVQLYPAGLVSGDVNMGEHVTVIESVKTTAGAGSKNIRAPYHVQADGLTSIEIDPDRLGSTMTVTVYNKLTGSYVRKTCDVVVTAASSAINGATLDIFFMGSSIAEATGIVNYTQDQLIALGATVTDIGTINQTDAYDTGETAAVGEGRGGTAFSDYTHEDTDRMAVPADSATYIAATSSEREELNPFIRASTGGDAAGIIKNGYVFDFDYYLTTYASSAEPDWVIICDPFVNELNQEIFAATVSPGGSTVAAGVASALAKHLNGLDIVLPQIRAALPSAKIGIFYGPLGHAGPNTAVWKQYMAQAFKAAINWVNDEADANIRVIPGWAMMPSLAGYGYATGTTDSDTGAVTTTVSDGTHFRAASRDAAVEITIASMAA